MTLSNGPGCFFSGHWGWQCSRGSSSHDKWLYQLKRFRHASARGISTNKTIKGRPKQPYAIAMKDGSPFGLAGIWENWQEPTSGEWIRTFAIITTDSNELVAQIHDRMPVILVPADYARWLGEEPDPRDLMRPFPAEPMRMWPISTRVNKPENEDPSIVEPVELATDATQ